MGAPDYGHRPLASLVDQIATTDPDSVWCYYPKSDNELQQGWQGVTFKRLANAVNRVAHRIEQDVGKSTTFATLAYIGPNDLRYPIFTLAAIKTGHQALFISPRNAIEGQLSLFEKTYCHHLSYASNMHKLVAPWLAQREMKAVAVDELAEWLDETEVLPYPYTRTWDQCHDEPFAVLHTSGSTGIPKPIIVKQGVIAVFDALHDIPPFDGRQHVLQACGSSGNVYCAMPFFHAAGLYLTFSMSVYYRAPIVVSPASRPLSVAVVEQIFDYANVGATMLPPSILEEMAQTRESIARLTKLKVVGFGGGALASGPGDSLANAGVRLVNMIASTEAGILALYLQEPEDWQWFFFNDELSGIRWDKQTGSDGLYEQVLVRQPCAVEQAVFYTFPDLDEWGTRDLFIKHPTKPNRWAFAGRADNIIVFSNGEKLNPTTIEDHAMGHPKVNGALVVGAGKFQPALIIEPREFPVTDEEKTALIEEIWPTIVKANKETVAHGQIGKQFVSLATAEKPFPRAGKGTIQRGLANQLYKEEIEKLYEEADVALETNASKLDVSSEEALRTSLEQAFKQQLGLDALESDTDFFSAGIDSMQVLTMSRTLRAGLEAASGRTIDADTIATRVIYTNPTPRRLAASLYSQVVSGKNSNNNEWLIQDMEALVEKYTRDLPTAKTTLVKPTETNLTVILTGSTGSLGSYILSDLIANSAVASVICLNRAADGHARQAAVSSERGLTTDFAKVKFLQADLSKDKLGLSRSDYTELLHSIDRIIHNQWQVNFNLSLASFEPFVRGTYNLAVFAATADKLPHITFASTIGTVDGWGSTQGTKMVPEASLSELDVPHSGYNLAGGGYGQSKQVASVILEHAAKKSGVQSAIVRIGQIAGPLSKKGEWNRHEWLPTILASSVYLDALPASLGMMDAVDWTPAEPLAGFLLDLAGVNESKVPAPQGYYHAVNPHMTDWKTLLPAVQAYFGGRITKTVPLGEWVQLLAQSESDTKDVGKNPGIKLLDFYKGLDESSRAGTTYMRLATEQSVAASPTLKALQAVQGSWMTNWLQQWNF